jgi:hypothetical protein
MGQLQEAEADFQRMVDLNPNCDEEARAALEKVREELRANGQLQKKLHSPSTSTTYTATPCRAVLAVLTGTSKAAGYRSQSR